MTLLRSSPASAPAVFVPKRPSAPKPIAKPSATAPKPAAKPASPAAIRDAKRLYDAMKGGAFGIGTDEAAVFAALDKKSPGQVAEIRSAYRQNYGRSLDADVKGEMSGAELARAQALLGSRQDKADAARLRHAMYGGVLGLGTNEGEIKATLQGKSAEQRQAIAKAYGKGGALGRDLKSELSNTELRQVNANTKVQRAAANLATATRGVGTDEAAIFASLSGLKPGERRELEQVFRKEQGRSLRETLQSELSGPDRDRAMALLNGNDAGAKAAALRGTLAGVGTDEAELNRQLKQLKPDERGAVFAAYQRTYGTSLNADIRQETSGLERAEAQAHANGKLAPAEELYFAMKGGLTGAGTDQERIRATLSHLSQAQIADAKADYSKRYCRDLVADLNGETSGREQLEVTQLLRGKNDESTGAGLQSAVRALGETQQLERGGLVSRTINDITGDHGQRLDRSTTAAQQALSTALADGVLTSAEKANVQAKLAYARGNADTYQASKDAVADGVSTGAATAAAIAVTVATGGAAAPTIALAAGVGSAAKVSTSAMLRGEAMSIEQAGTDVIMGAVDGALTPLGMSVGMKAAGRLTGTVVAKGDDVVRNSAVRRGLARAAGGATEGAFGGGVSGATGAAIDGGTWKHGVVQGAGQLLAAGANAAAANVVVGGGASMLARGDIIDADAVIDIAGQVRGDVGAGIAEQQASSALTSDVTSDET